MKYKDEWDLSDTFIYGMHACGFAHDIMFTNCLEALNQWYDSGVRLFEVDVDLADDGVFVACHDFGRPTFIKMEIEESAIPAQCTSEWFLNQKLYSKSTGGLTPMSLANIFEIMNQRSDVLVMIDPKQYSYKSTKQLLEVITFYIRKYDICGRRIFFETYNTDMIEASIGYGETVQLQYCVGDEMEMGTSSAIRGWETDVVMDYLSKYNIRSISYPWKFAVEDLKTVKKYKDQGFTLFSKTRNDILSDLLRKCGVNVNLVDHLVDDEQRNVLQSYRKEYERQYGDIIGEQ